MEGRPLNFVISGQAYFSLILSHPSIGKRGNETKMCSSLLRVFFFLVFKVLTYRKVNEVRLTLFFIYENHVIRI